MPSGFCQSQPLVSFYARTLTQRFTELCNVRQASTLLASLASRLFVLADLKRENINKFSGLLIYPKLFLKDMDAFDRALALPDMDNDHAVRVAVYKYGRTASAQALMMELVQDRVMNGYAPKALEIIQNWDVPDFPVSGDDLIKAGHKPGPKLGIELASLEGRWIEGDFSESKESLLSDA